MHTATSSMSWYLLLAGVAALDNGFGRTPVMGYNSYNDVGCSPNSTYMAATINAFADKGFGSLGYKYFQVDCGWQGYDRLQNGSITYDASVFPDGITPLSQLAIRRGFKWSMYTDQGVNSCDTRSDKLRPGSLGYEKQDAAMFAAWNTAYMKVDNCYVDPGQNAPKDPRTDYPSRYGAISSALLNRNIPGILICQWGAPYRNPSGTLQGPSAWTPALSNSYRVSDDIATGWANVQRIMNQAIHVNLNGLSGPGRFADMDLLEVGNSGMTVDEQATHFAIWSMFKSALMVSTPVMRMSADTANILKNQGLIAINQDTLGAPVKLVQRFTDDFDVFAGNLSNGDKAVLVADQTDTRRTLSLDFASLGISRADVKDLWTGAVSSAVGSFSKTVNAHGSMALRLSNIKKATSNSPVLTYIEAEAGVVSGGANVQRCGGCSNGSKVGNLIGSASLVFNNINAKAATLDVAFDYINCDVGYLGDQGPNVRGASISVNGGAIQKVRFPLTGYNWDADSIKGFKVRLSGFKVGGGNKITITALGEVSSYAPDFDRVGIPS